MVLLELELSRFKVEMERRDDETEESLEVNTDS